MRFLLFFFLIGLWMNPAAAQDALFRGFIWGATKEDVRKFETAPFYKDEGDQLFFVEEKEAFRPLITYTFQDGRLIAAKYELQEFHEPNPENVLNRLSDTQASLKKLYGQPISEEMIWRTRTYQYLPRFWGRALYQGSLWFRTLWRNEYTQAVLEAYHDGLFYQINYTSFYRNADAPVAQEDQNYLTLPEASDFAR